MRRRRKPFGLYPVTGYGGTDYRGRRVELRLPPERGPMHAAPPAPRYRVTVPGTSFVALFVDEPPAWYLADLGRIRGGEVTSSKKATAPIVEVLR